MKMRDENTRWEKISENTNSIKWVRTHNGFIEVIMIRGGRQKISSMGYGKLRYNIRFVVGFGNPDYGKEMNKYGLTKSEAIKIALNYMR